MLTSTEEVYLDTIYRHFSRMSDLRNETVIANNAINVLLAQQMRPEGRTPTFPTITAQNASILLFKLGTLWSNPIPLFDYIQTRYIWISMTSGLSRTVGNISFSTPWELSDNRQILASVYHAAPLRAVLLNRQHYGNLLRSFQWQASQQASRGRCERCNTRKTTTGRCYVCTHSEFQVVEVKKKIATMTKTKLQTTSELLEEARAEAQRVNAQMASEMNAWTPTFTTNATENTVEYRTTQRPSPTGRRNTSVTFDTNALRYAFDDVDEEDGNA